jgi:hypothetical protein
MPRGIDDAVRAYQLPTNAPGQLYLSQYNLASNTPVMITPGFGGSGGGQLPPIQTGSGHYDITITHYMDQAATEEQPRGRGPGGGGGAPGAGGRGGTPTDGRQAHVKRVFQLEDNPNYDPSNLDAGPAQTINPDIWVDMLRIDQLPVIFQSTDDGRLGQRIIYKLKWNDDPNDQDPTIDNSAADVQAENANISSRKTRQLKIKNPESPDDLTAQLKLWIVEKLRVERNGKETGKSGQGVQYVFNNTPITGDPDNPDAIPNLKRTTSVIKVMNNDLAGMKMSDDDGSNPVLVDWFTYTDALSSEDAEIDTGGVHLDVEVTDNLWVGFGADEDSGIVGQIIQFILQPGNNPIEDWFEQGDISAVDVNGDPAVVRTDPLQDVVNVNFGGLAVIFGVKDEDAPKKPSWYGKGPT